MSLGLVSDIEKDIDFISTGSWIIDRLIGDGTGTGAPGGIPRGYITEIFGNESCGKTTLALECVKTVQNMGESCLWVDYEHSLRTQKYYLRNLGIKINTSSFIAIGPDNYEQGINMLGKALTYKPAMIVIDSLAAATPSAVANGDADATQAPGLHARLTSLFLSWVNKRLEKSNTALVILNQKRKAIKGQYESGPDEVTAGGMAIRFYPTIRIEMKSMGKETVATKSDLTGMDDKVAVNQTTKVTVVKSKLDMPWRSAPIYIKFGQGIDGLRSLIELAIKKKVITGSGWYEFKHQDESLNFKRQGVGQVWKYLVENPRVVDALYPLCLPEVDTLERDTSDEIDDMDDEEGIAAVESGLGKSAAAEVDIDDI